MHKKSSCQFSQVIEAAVYTHGLVYTQQHTHCARETIDTPASLLLIS